MMMKKRVSPALSKKVSKGASGRSKPREDLNALALAKAEVEASKIQARARLERIQKLKSIEENAVRVNREAMEEAERIKRNAKEEAHAIKVNAIAEAQNITAQAEQNKADADAALATKQRETMESIHKQLREAETAAAKITKAAEVEATRIRLAAHEDAKKQIAQAVFTEQTHLTAAKEADKRKILLEKQVLAAQESAIEAEGIADQIKSSAEEEAVKIVSNAQAQAEAIAQQTKIETEALVQAARSRQEKIQESVGIQVQQASQTADQIMRDAKKSAAKALSLTSLRRAAEQAGPLGQQNNRRDEGRRPAWATSLKPDLTAPKLAWSPAKRYQHQQRQQKVQKVPRPREELD